MRVGGDVCGGSLAACSAYTEESISRDKLNKNQTCHEIQSSNPAITHLLPRTHRCQLRPPPAPRTASPARGPPAQQISDLKLFFFCVFFVFFFNDPHRLDWHSLNVERLVLSGICRQHTRHAACRTRLAGHLRGVSNSRQCVLGNRLVKMEEKSANELID